MKREEYISDEAVVKRVNEAVRIELDKRKRWSFQSSDMTGKLRSYTRRTATDQG